VDARLRDEAARYALRFRCEACAHFVEEVGTCANGYPNQAHLSAPLESVAELEFCKEFELV
jgi:hypothetical protein